MVGVIIAAHGNLAQEFIRVVEGITGSPLEGVYGVSIDADKPSDQNAQIIDRHVKLANTGHGVLLITDMFSGTPSNIALTFLETNKVEVLSGLNLPMMIGLIGNSNRDNLAELAREIRSIGRENVLLASEYLSHQDPKK